ncbi:methyltransferase family protein [Roseibium hamelinense]|uniref:Methyltransferase family protein n=1 Tax=Roseibium hamelinense TaxID=150831 RepID=A0A562T0Y6_9HYPH|nr:class I SAM-dependent methyltransferase [Roseibium hamelinense]TWI87259.1 methyltransferase family protein [Roseibium hamelinense]
MAEALRQFDSTFDNRLDALEIFRNDWQIYKRLVELNYFHHTEVAAHLEACLEKDIPAGFSFLDLACGDAAMPSTILSQVPVASYTGIDLSGPALALAARNLDAATYQTKLECRDMLQALSMSQSQFDFIWCGLSVHHLSLENKARFMQLAHHALKPGGVLMIYEPVLSNGETATSFNRRMHHVLKARWNQLTEREFSRIWEHIEECDKPETADTWLTLGLYAGFVRNRTVFSQPDGGYCRLFKYRKSANEN